MTIEIPPTELVREALKSSAFYSVMGGRLGGKTEVLAAMQAAQCWLTLCDKVGDDAARALVEGE